MAAIDLGDVEDFPFLDPPDRRQVRDGIALLQELGALDESGRKLTPLGRKLAQLPIDPRMGRMVIEADRLGCVEEVIVIASALSIQDVRERPADQQAQADQAHARHADESSDFLAFWNLWRYLHERRGELSVNQFRKQAKSEFLHYLRIREWQDLVGQVRQAAKGVGIRSTHVPAEPEAIHQAILTGLLSHLGRARRLAARLSGRPRRAVRALAGRGREGQPELGDGQRAGRDLAAVGPDGGEDRPALGRARGRAPRAAHLRRAALGPQAGVGRGHRAGHALRAADRGRAHRAPTARSTRRSRATCSSGARWSRASGTRGTASSPPTRRWSRRSRRSRTARGGATSSSTTRRCTTSTRRGSPTASSPARTSTAGGATSARVRPDLLTFTRELLINPAAAEDVAGRPDVWTQGELELQLSYRFEPGSAHDGVTVHVPLKVLPQLRAAGFEWLVPALRSELVVALIRSLPKELRKRLVPVPEIAAKVLERLEPRRGPLLEALAAEIEAQRGVRIEVTDWDLARLPAYLKMTFSVEDEQGRVIASGQDLSALREQVRPKLRAALAAATRKLERTGQTTWTFGTIPKAVALPGHGPDRARLHVAGRRGRDGRACGRWRAPRRSGCTCGRACGGCWR